MMLIRPVRMFACLIILASAREGGRRRRGERGGGRTSKKIINPFLLIASNNAGAPMPIPIEEIERDSSNRSDRKRMDKSVYPARKVVLYADTQNVYWMFAWDVGEYDLGSGSGGTVHGKDRKDGMSGGEGRTEEKNQG